MQEWESKSKRNERSKKKPLLSVFKLSSSKSTKKNENQLDLPDFRLFLSTKF